MSSSSPLFPVTLAATQDLLNSIVCESCGTSTSHLFSLASCQHTFCRYSLSHPHFPQPPAGFRKCTSTIQDKKQATRLCPVCQKPVDAKDARENKVVAELRELTAALIAAIQALNPATAVIDSSSSDQSTTAAFDPDATRLTQQQIEQHFSAELQQQQAAESPPARSTQLFSPPTTTATADNPLPLVPFDNGRRLSVSSSMLPLTGGASGDGVFSSFSFFPNPPQRTFADRGKKQTLDKIAVPPSLLMLEQGAAAKPPNNDDPYSLTQELARQEREEGEETESTTASDQATTKTKRLPATEKKAKRKPQARRAKSDRHSEPTSVDNLELNEEEEGGSSKSAAETPTIPPPPKTRRDASAAGKKRQSMEKTKTTGGELPLHKACASGDLAAVHKLLTTDNANPNVFDNSRWTPLHAATTINNVAIMTALLEAGAIVDVADGQQCRTALHLAVLADSIDATSVLLAKGADLAAVDLYGKTAADLAKDDGQVKPVLAAYRPGAVIRDVPRDPDDYIGTNTAAVCVQFQRSAELNNVQSYADFLKKHGGTVSSLSSETISPETTHFIVKVDADQRTERTTSVLEAILRGVWIVSDEWLHKSVHAGRLLNPEPFEVCGLTVEKETIGDWGPRKGREARLKMRPGLFTGCQIRISAHRFDASISQSAMEQLIRAGNGVTLSRLPNLATWMQDAVIPYYSQFDDHGRFSKCGLFVVYQPGQKVSDKCLAEQQIHCVTPMWLCECIAKYELVPPDDRPQIEKRGKTKRSN